MQKEKWFQFLLKGLIAVCLFCVPESLLYNLVSMFITLLLYKSVLYDWMWISIFKFACRLVLFWCISEFTWNWFLFLIMNNRRKRIYWEGKGQISNIRFFQIIYVNGITTCSVACIMKHVRTTAPQYSIISLPQML